MKKKTGMYLAIGIIGIALALIAKFLLQDYLSDSQSGAMIGIGAGLFGYGIAKSMKLKKKTSAISSFAAKHRQYPARYCTGC